MDSTMGRRLSVGSISPIFCTLTSDERICGCEFQALVVITLVTRVRVVLVTTSDHVHVCADPRDTGLPRTSQAMQSASLQISSPPIRGCRSISAEKMSPTAQSHGKRRWWRWRNHARSCVVDAHALVPKGCRASVDCTSGRLGSLGGLGVLAISQRWR